LTVAAIAEYRILSAPRFASDEMDVRLFDSFVSQRALWAHLALHLVRDHGVTAEYRITHFDRITVALRLHGNPTEAVLARIAQAEAMLPSGYKWRRVAPDGTLDEAPLRIARIVRRLELVDLPVPSRELERSEDQQASDLFDAEPAEAGLRRIPTLDTDPEDLLSERFCLPLPGPLDELLPRTKSLFQEIHREGPVVLSICLHPIDPAEHWENQIHALGWKRFLDPFAGELASAGFADVRSLRSSYDRYALPPGYLVHTSIRVGGGNDRAVVGLANMVAAANGGFRAFQVHPPSREVRGSALLDPTLDCPRLWSHAQRRRQWRALREQLMQGGVGEMDDDSVLSFMLRAPHLYTLQEAEQLVRFPIADEEGLPGFASAAVPPFAVPSLSLHRVDREDHSIAQPPDGRFRVGMLQQPGSMLLSGEHRFAAKGWYTIDPVELTKHALIVGSTGSGKTMSTLFLARELDRLGIPFLVIEPVKTEYYDRLRAKVPKLKRLRFEADAMGFTGSDFVTFDPLRVPGGVSVMRHASYLKSCFEAAFPLEPLIALLLETALIEYYTKPVAEGACAFRKFARGGPQLGSIRGGKVFPSYATFLDFLLGPFLTRSFSAGAAGAAGAAGRADEFRDIFRRRFSNLSASILGTSFRIADDLYLAGAKANGGIPRPEYYDVFASLLLNGPVVVELDAIPDSEQKALAMAFLLTYVFERRQAEDLAAREGGPAVPAGLRHLLIVEEAHRLLSTAAAQTGRGGEVAGQSSQAKAVSLFVDMLAEIRAFGQGLAIVEQIPSKIVPEAVKNTNLKMMMRLAARDDREYLGNAMNFTEAHKRFVTNLKVDKPGDDLPGQVNFVMFEEGVEQPLLLSLPLPDSAGPQGDWLYDEHF
jgi:hypothetical protein